MTDKETLFLYRLKQAEETLSDADKMLRNNLSPRSVINRAYYSMFYAVLALFISKDVNIRTSKHTGVISIFDKEFVHTGKADKHHSKMLHRMFNIRQEADHKELAEISVDDAIQCVKQAKIFLHTIREIIHESEKR